MLTVFKITEYALATGLLLTNDVVSYEQPGPDQPGPRKMGHLTEHTNVDIRLILKTGSIELLYSPSVWSKRADKSGKRKRKS